jgi:hypothetical protein
MDLLTYTGKLLAVNLSGLSGPGVEGSQTNATGCMSVDAFPSSPERDAPKPTMASLSPEHLAVGLPTGAIHYPEEHEARRNKPEAGIPSTVARPRLLAYALSATDNEGVRRGSRRNVSTPGPSADSREDCEQDAPAQLSAACWHERVNSCPETSAASSARDVVGGQIGLPGPLTDRSVRLEWSRLSGDTRLVVGGSGDEWG